MKYEELLAFVANEQLSFNGIYLAPKISKVILNNTNSADFLTAVTIGVLLKCPCYDLS